MNELNHFKSLLEKKLSNYITDKETMYAMEEQFIEFCEENKNFVEIFILANKEYLEKLKKESL